MPIRSEDIELHDLNGLPRARLRARWREVFDEQPPAAFGRELLALGIAYALQDRRFGDLLRSLQSKLCRPCSPVSSSGPYLRYTDTGRFQPNPLTFKI